MKQSIFEQNGGTYREESEYLIPNLLYPENNKHSIGKYGQIHLDYLKKHKRDMYSTLLIKGRLNAYLAEIDSQAKETVDLIVEKSAKQEGLTEAFKAANSLEWMQKMNMIQLCAEELVKEEILLC